MSLIDTLTDDRINEWIAFTRESGAAFDSLARHAKREGLTDESRELERRALLARRIVQVMSGGNAGERGSA